MYHYYARVLLVATCFCALLLNGVAAQTITFDNKTRIATSGGIIAVANVGSPNACSTQGLLFLTSSTTECLTFKSADGSTTVSTSCPPDVVGSTAIACGVRFCHVSNPVTQQIVIIDATNNGTVVRTYGSGSVTTPSAITVYEGEEPNVNFFEVFVIDALDNSLWYFKIRKVGEGPSGTVTPQNLYTSTLTGAPLGVYRQGGNFARLLLAFKGQPNVHNLYFIASTTGPATILDQNFYFDPAFTSIDLFYTDTYQRLFIHDASCACTTVFYNPSTVSTIPDEANPPISFASSKNHIYSVDSLGVTRYNEPALQISIEVTNKQCQNVLGDVQVRSAGGSFPLEFYIYPDHLSKIGFTTFWYPTATVAFGDLDVSQPVYPITLFNETLNSFYVLDPFDTVIERVNSSVVTPYNGNYSYSFTFASSGRFYYYGSAFAGCISPQYTTAEFMLNIGDGDQSIRIDVFYAEYDSGGMANPEHGDMISTLYIYPGDLPLHNWTKISMPIPATATGFIFRDLDFGGVHNPFYIDEWILIPDNSPRRVVVKDFCGAVVTSENFEINNDNAFTTTLLSTPSTCNAAQTANGDNTTNGAVTASIHNGVAPFALNWIFEGADNTSETVTNLTALTTFDTIYDNALNSSWIDSSDIQHNMSDTTYYHSAPYSISMTMKKGYNSAVLKFSSDTAIDGYVGSTISVWVYGGPIGLQSVFFFLAYRDNLLGYSELDNMIPGCKNAGIPPNVWHKATYYFDNDYRFSDITFMQSRNFAQNTLYLDDLTFSLKPAVMVFDSAGCSAIAMDLAVLSPPPLQVSTKATNALCYNTSSGTVALGVDGGTAPYTIHYSTGNVNTRTDIVSVIRSLPETKIVFDVTDANGCTATQAVETILQPPPMSLSLANEPVKCYGGSTSITSSMSGGTAPYTYAWSSTSPIAVVPQPEPVPIFSDSLSLLYTLSSNVKAKCLGTGLQSSLTYPPSHSGYCSLFPTFSLSTPSVNITAPGITPSKYAGMGMWIYVENSTDAQNLQIALARGAAVVSTPVSIASLATITPGAWNKIYFNITNTTLSNQNPTQILITSTSPSNMGRVILDDIVLIPTVASSIGIIVHSGFNSIVGGNAGKYFLTVVDANGCSFTKQVIIDQPAQLQIRADIQSASSNSAKDGSIYVTALGGTPPYTFRWPEINVAGANASDLTYGGYSVQVTDANGCVFTEKFVVQFEDRLTVRKYDSKLSGGLGAIVGLGTLVGLFGLTMLIIFWRSFSRLGNFFSFVITIGVLVSYIAVLVLLPEPTDQLCVAYPWLLGIAFTFVYGCLFLKTWALYRVWMKAIQYKKSNLTTFSILRTVGIVLLVEVAILAAWTAVDPPKVHMVKVEGNSLQAQCDTDEPTFWIIFVCIKGAWLIFGAILCVLTRNLKKEYNESSNIAYSIYAILILMAIAVPLALLLDSVPGGRLVIEVIVPVIAFTSTLIIMFYNTWRTSIAGDHVVKVNGMGGSSNTTAAYSTNRSRGGSNSPNNSKTSNHSSQSSKSTEMTQSTASRNLETNSRNPETTVEMI